MISEPGEKKQVSWHPSPLVPFYAVIIALIIIAIITFFFPDLLNDYSGEYLS